MDQIDLSIIIPSFNEKKFLPNLLKSLSELEFVQPISHEIIIIDDASTDGTSELFDQITNSKLTYRRLDINSGKGAAVKRGISLAKGRYLIIQDADLEYMPHDIPALLQCAFMRPGSTVYGSRVLGAKKLRSFNGIIRIWPNQSISSFVFNYILSIWLFFLKQVWITDSLTGYKLYPKEVFEKWIPITNGFEMDHEITMKILNTEKEIIEIPINYLPRSRSEGKKIRPIDGLIALRTMWKFRQ